MGRLRIVWLVLAVALLAGCGARGAEDEGIQEGQRLPDAEFVTFAGETISIHELRGRPLVINFWATWCGPCKEEIPMLQQAYERSNRTNFQLIAVTDELQTTVRQFMAQGGMTFPVVFDQGGRAGSRYRVQAIPTTIFVDSEGVVVARHVGGLSAADIAEYLGRFAPAQPAPTSAPAGPTAPAQPAPTAVPAPRPGHDGVGLRPGFGG